MLKTIVPLERLIFEKLEVYDGKADKFGVDGGEEIAKKSGKSKSEKLFKS